MSSTKKCVKCGEAKPLSEFHRAGKGHRARCKSCRSQEHHAKYGVDRSYADYLLSGQKGKCAACNREIPGTPCIHHNHLTGGVTALLCHACNKLEGMIRRNPHVVRFMMWENWALDTVEEFRNAIL